ncbi:MAG: IS4 family transposase [Verrucomicrobiales bacterium]|nr:IS4 family transposase [Verrucomicrobiales bacterium]
MTNPPPPTSLPGVLDAVRIAGRWVSVHVLARLSARALGEDPPPRQTLLRDFCRATHWRNRKGHWCLASAHVALQRLEARGLVRLPPPAPRAARQRPRQLVDDGLPLPALPPAGASLQELRLQRIRDQHDPDHGLWNRLIVREHPLQGAPLVGAQLRYLIRHPQGVVGAFGVGPAAYYLGCRDAWIGWDDTTRQAHLPQVLGLARFLLRPGPRWPNLASHCYGLLVAQVAADWQERYGVRPVLLETFVERSTQTGTSLSAANWQRLGQSQGYGRSRPAGKGARRSAKDVWVYELVPQARASLRRGATPVVVPRSVFCGWEAETWTPAETDGLALGDRRLERRWEQMLRARWHHPPRSFFASFGSRAAGKAAYRLVESPRAEVTFQSLLAPHAHQTQRRMAAERLVVLAQDTTALSYNTLRATRGLGVVGDRRNPGRGLWLHSLQAFRADGIPLGCSWAKLWAREEESDTERRNEQSVSEKESGRWIEAYQSAARLAEAMPQTQLTVCGDRESDIFELFDQSEVAPRNLRLLVRAQHDRVLSSGQKLWHQLREQPLGGTLTVRVPRRGDRPARMATLEVRWLALEAASPRVALKKSWSPIRLWAVLAQEVDPPQGAEAIEWVLVTDWEVEGWGMAVRMIRWYSVRWGIECWHQVLKGGCGVEQRQMESARALERALVLDMIVAWRAFLLCRLGKHHPALPASLYYAAEELAVLEVYRERLPAHAQGVVAAPASALGPGEAEAPAPVPEGPPAKGRARGGLSLYQANLLVAMLAGFWTRKSDGHPGPRRVGEGLMILAELVNYRRLTGQVPHGTPARSKRPREPG